MIKRSKLRNIILALSLSSTMLMTPAALAQDGDVLNYRDADIRVFIDDVAAITGRTFIIDPRVRGKVNVVSTEAVDLEGVFQTFLSALKVNGFTVVPTASGAFKVVPDEIAAQDAGPVGETRKGDTLVTRVFNLRYADPLAVQAAAKPFVFKNGRVFARRGMPVMIVTDYADNLERIAKLVASMDVDHSVVQTIALENTSAGEMAEIIVKLSQQAGFDDNVNTTLMAMPVESSNTLIIKGQQAIIDTYLPVIRNLDQNNASRSDLRVVHLKYATAEQMLPMLETVTRALTKGEGGAVQGGNSDVSVSAYTGSNAIIINASSEMQQRIANVIHQLDVPQAQVLVEAIVVEVSEGAAKDLGVQYILAGGDSSNIPFTVTNYSNTAPNILALTGALQLDGGNGGNDDSDGLGNVTSAAVESLLGFNGFGLGFAGETDGGTVFGAILNALETDTGSNVLSTPSIMTMDNQKAKFLSGQEIPITTGQTLTAASTNPFTTIERKDVGVQLEVTPQVNDNDEISLFIRQEISSVAGSVSTSSNELVTNKREIETRVRIKSGEIVVLGGLVQEDEAVSVDKVPFLGDIPILGRAFRSDRKSRSRTNLMIFLRPTIVNTPADAQALTAKKFQYMQGQQRAAETQTSLDQLVEEVMGSEQVYRVDQPEQQD